MQQNYNHDNTTEKNHHLQKLSLSKANNVTKQTACQLSLKR